MAWFYGRSPGHLLNDFEINKFHNIQSGIILHGSRAYAFTQITNDDIHSHLKILIRGKSLRDDIPTSKGVTILQKYVRFKSTEKIVPSIHQIQENIYSTLDLSDQLYIDEKKHYALLHQMYLLIFMLHYHMPLQRRHLPGRRNTSKSRYSHTNKGW